MLKKVLSLLAAMALSVAVLSGCGGQETPVAQVGKVQEYLDDNSAEFESQFDAMASAFGEGVSFELKGVGDDEMVMSLKFGETLPEGVDASMLEAGLSGQEAVFGPMADSLETEIGVDNMKITVQYLDKDGNVLAEKTFGE
jgi:hypothetical protein